MADKENPTGGKLGRRDLLRSFSLTAAIGLSGSELLASEEKRPAKTVRGMAFEPKQTVRMALIGASFMRPA